MAEWTCRACTARYAVGAPACPQCGSTERAEDRVLNLPTIRVACGTDGCRYEDQERTARLRSAGLGLVEMPTLLCAGCGRMPLVISHWSPIPDQEEEEDDVPKTTVHNGPSNDNPPAGDAVPGEQLPEPPAGEGAEAIDPAPGEGESSPGNSSSTSSATEPTSPEKSEQQTRSRARRTGSRSSKAQTESSTAASTDGDQTAATSDKASE